MSTTALQEALTAVGASALIQKQIDPMLLEYQRRYAPVVRAIESIKWGSTVYYFNQRTVNPAGGFVTDGGARPVSVSTYVQNQYTIKNLQSVGAVTGYAQAVTADLIGNLRASEIQGAARGLYWDIETATMWGNASATVAGPYPEFDGLDTLLNQYSGQTENSINWAGANFSLGALDQLIDLVEQNVAEPVESSSWMFIVSPTANSRLSQLFTNQQRFVDEVEVATGLTVPSYRDIPIVKTSFLNARGTAMGTISGALSAGGTLNATYKYMVTAVISRFGETLVSNEITVSPSTQEVVLSFTPPGSGGTPYTDPTTWEGALPMLYKVYRTAAGGGAGTETLLGVVDAFVGLASDGVTPVFTNQIIDTGTNLIAQQSSGSVQQSSPPAAYVSTNSNVLPPVNNYQTVYLLSRDPQFVCRPYVREMQPVDIYPTTSSPDALPFAFVADTALAVRAPKYVGRLTGANVVLSS